MVVAAEFLAVQSLSAAEEQTAPLGSYLNSHKATKAETYWWEVYTQEFIFI